MTRAPASDRRLARLANLLADRYQFLSLLGEGGSGTVYEVSNRSLERIEALKVLTDAFQEAGASARFAQEARVAAALAHPNIVKVHAFGQEEGIHWYSMELIDGPALGDLVEAGVHFDPAMFLRLAMPILGALAFSHERGVIHRDIKPANILFDLAGRPCLADFGVAKTAENVLRTRTGQLLGTPAYVAPEQALGEPVDARADQYSLGITLYKTLTGALPFTADTILQTLVLRLREDPQPIGGRRPDLDPRLGAILMRSLERDRAARWDSVADMRQALLDYCGQAGIAWDRPVAEVRAYPLQRRPLPDPGRPPEGAPGPAQGSFEPTADMPAPAAGAGRRRLALLGASVLLAAAAGWVAWPRAGTGAPVPAPAAPPVSAPAPARPLPAPVRTPGPRPAAPLPPAPARVPAVYPELLGTPAVPTAATGCAGLRVTVSLRVGEDGAVQSCRILSPITPACAEAARAIAMQYHFKPALDAQGQPLATTIAAAVDFPESP